MDFKILRIYNILKSITSHPLNRHSKIRALIRFVKWQMNTKLNPFPIIYPFTDKSKLIIQKGMTGATGNLYCGLHEFNEMSFLLHFLRRDDYFVDVGANIGSYTILASAHVGAKVISIEPVPSTFLNLRMNICINQMDKNVETYNIAIGSKTGMINFTSSFDTTNHVATEEDLKDNAAGIIKVPIKTLDEIINDFQIPILLKIDTEGFETEVIAGASRLLSKNTLKAIIIELNDKYKINEMLTKFGFKAFQYDPFNRELISRFENNTNNAIYIRDIEFIQKRLKTAEKFKILNHLI